MNDLCPLCKITTENLTYILICSNLVISFSSFIYETQKALKSIILLHLNLQLQNLFTQFKNPINIFNLILNPNTIKSFISICYFNFLSKHFFQNKILKLFKHTIWTQHNNNMILEENQNNITKKIKYSSKINKKSKNNKKFINNKKTNPYNITNTMSNPNTNTASNN